MPSDEVGDVRGVVRRRVEDEARAALEERADDLAQLELGQDARATVADGVVER